MDDSKMLKDIKSAGAWFVSEYAATILENFEQLKFDKSYKAELVRKIHYECKRDKDLGGTKTRVYALIRIIERKELEEALNYVIKSNKVNLKDPQAVSAAEETLKNRYW